MFAALLPPAAAIDQHADLGVAVDGAVLARHEKFKHQIAAAAIDDVLGLEEMAVHGGNLTLAADHDLFGIDHAAAGPQVGGQAVAHGEKEQPQLLEPALTIIGDVPAHRAAHDLAMRGGFHLIGRPVGEGRQDIAEGADEAIGREQDFIDVGTVHGRGSFARLGWQSMA